MTTIATGPEGVNRYILITLKHGLKLYRDTGIKPNRQWTAANMRAAAQRFTGKQFKARDYDGMISALEGVIADITDVEVWDYNSQSFIESFRCPGEKRVRVDRSSLKDLAVFQVVRRGNGAFQVMDDPKPLTDWVISMS